MPNQEFLAALNNVYYISMPTFNDSSMMGYPPEVQSVFRQLIKGGSAIEDIAADIAAEAKSETEVLAPEVIFQILTALEQTGLVTHSDAVSGYNGMMISNSADDVLSTDSVTLGNMFSPDKVAPVLNSSQAIATMGDREDQILVNNYSDNPLSSAGNVVLSVSSPPIFASDPRINTSTPAISASVPPISSSVPPIFSSVPPIANGQGN